MSGSFVLAACTGLCFVLCVIGVGLVASDEHMQAQEDDDEGDGESPLVHFLLIWAVTKGMVWASNLVVATIMFLYHRESERQMWSQSSSSRQGGDGGFALFDDDETKKGPTHAAYPLGLHYPA